MATSVHESFLKIDPSSDFPIQNLPMGVFKRLGVDEAPRIGVAIGDHVLDVKALSEGNFLSGIAQNSKALQESTLNSYMSLGRPAWVEVRSTLQRLLSKDEGVLRDNAAMQEKVLIPLNKIENILPAKIGNYTDFYASKEHATNVGTMFRGKDNALMPNWTYIPIGYHGRASSVVISGTNLRRPKGQTRPNDAEPPVFGPSKVVDYEVEVACFVGPSSKLGEPISIEKAEDHIFGFVLMNDWSARDIQKWEYVPLGPFGAKNWGTTLSPWIVSLEALEEFRVAGPEQLPVPFDYLKDKKASNYDIELQASLQTEKSTKPQVVTSTNFKYMYWSMKQQLVHHTITGCNMETGDLLGSGTISGPTPNSFGSLLEVTWQGKNPFTIEETKEERKYIQDGDSIIMTGHAQGKGYKVGFGECKGKILPAL